MRGLLNQPTQWLHKLTTRNEQPTTAFTRKERPEKTTEKIILAPSRQAAKAPRNKPTTNNQKPITALQPQKNAKGAK
jgi:hypothetical protein